MRPPPQHRAHARRRLARHRGLVAPRPPIRRPHAHGLRDGLARWRGATGCGRIEPVEIFADRAHGRPDHDMCAHTFKKLAWAALWAARGEPAPEQMPHLRGLADEAMMGVLRAAAERTDPREHGRLSQARYERLMPQLTRLPTVPSRRTMGHLGPADREQLRGAGSPGDGGGVGA
jgi:hypothetical protein